MGSGDPIYLTYCATYSSLDAALIDAWYSTCYDTLPGYVFALWEKRLVLTPWFLVLFWFWDGWGLTIQEWHGMEKETESRFYKYGKDLKIKIIIKKKKINRQRWFATATSTQPSPPQAKSPPKPQPKLLPLAPGPRGANPAVCSPCMDSHWGTAQFQLCEPATNVLYVLKIKARIQTWCISFDFHADTTGMNVSIMSGTAGMLILKVISLNL